MDTEVLIPPMPGMRQSVTEKRNICFYPFMNFLPIISGQARNVKFFHHAVDP